MDDILRENKIVSKLRPKPNLPPNSVTIIGYVTKSEDPENIVRLYTDLNFDTYVDIPKSSIITATKLPQDPLETVYIWVDKNTDVRKVHIDIKTTKAEQFLEGEIAKKYLKPERLPAPTPPPGREKGERRMAADEATNKFMYPGSAVDACPSALVRCVPPSMVTEECPPPKSQEGPWGTCQPSQIVGCPPSQDKWGYCDPPITQGYSCPSQGGPRIFRYLSITGRTMVGSVACQPPKSQGFTCPSKWCY